MIKERKFIPEAISYFIIKVTKVKQKSEEKVKEGKIDDSARNEIACFDMQ